MREGGHRLGAGGKERGKGRHGPRHLGFCCRREVAHLAAGEPGSRLLDGPALRQPAVS